MPNSCHATTYNSVQTQAAFDLVLTINPGLIKWIKAVITVG